MPRKHEQSVTTCPPAEVDTGLQVETVLPRSTRGRRQVAAPILRVGTVAPRLPRITRLVALAIKCQDMVDRGEVRDYAGLASLGYVTRARITQIMNLLLLAPDLQESLLFMDTSHGSPRSERSIRSIAALPLWTDQRAAFDHSPVPTLGSEVHCDRKAAAK
jgi:hypothetical protein